MIQTEIELSLVLSEDDHPGLVKLIDVISDRETVVLIMELVTGSNLFNWLMEN